MGAFIADRTERMDRRAERGAYFWYRIDNGHVRAICAQDEDAARAAVIAQNPYCAGQRVTIVRVVTHGASATSAAAGVVSVAGVAGAAGAAGPSASRA